MLESLIKTIHPVSTGHGLVRIGNIGDGGYIVPDCIAGIECVCHQVLGGQQPLS